MRYSLHRSQFRDEVVRQELMQLFTSRDWMCVGHIIISVGHTGISLGHTISSVHHY